jgi:hypothetical protein
MKIFLRKSKTKCSSGSTNARRRRQKTTKRKMGVRKRIDGAAQANWEILCLPNSERVRIASVITIVAKTKSEHYLFYNQLALEY